MSCCNNRGQWSLTLRSRSLKRFITSSRIPDRTISKSVNIRPYTVEFSFLSFPCLDSTSSRWPTTKTDALPSKFIYMYVWRLSHDGLWLFCGKLKRFSCFWWRLLYLLNALYYIPIQEPLQKKEDWFNVSKYRIISPEDPVQLYLNNFSFN